MLALLLRRQHRTRERCSSRAMHDFLAKSSHPKRGHETLAIVYSLPYAMLMWGVVTFFLAFFIMCFDKSTTETRFVVAPVSLFCIVLIAWCIRVAWEPSETLEWWRAQLRWETSGDKEMGFWQRFCIGRRNPPAANPDV